MILALAAAAVASVSDPVELEWKGTSYRVGGPIPVRVATRDEPTSKTLGPGSLVLRASDGKERRLRSSATATKVVSNAGMWFTDCDAGELDDDPPAGAFTLAYEFAEGRRTKPLEGRLFSPLRDPKAALAKDPAKVAVLLETSLGPMLIGLRPDKAPQTVQRFVKLSSDGFYDGKVFHRIVRGFVAQGGGYRTDGTLETAPTLQGEFSDLSHERGVISMARLEKDPDSATSQFFLCLANRREALDRKYAAFGRVLEGFETLDRLSHAPVSFSAELNETSKPLEPPVIRKATVVEKP